MRRHRLLRPLALAALLAGCDDSGPAGDGRIEVTIVADGSAPDGVGYTLTLDGRDPRLLPEAGGLVYTGVPAGSHLVHLFALPEGCEVVGTNPRVVEVFGDGTGTVAFTVACSSPESGGFRVEVVTAGEPLDEDGYQLSVAGTALRVIEVNDQETYVNLAPGVYLITLKDVTPECRVEAGNPRPFTVVPGRSELVRFRVTCGVDPAPR